MNRLTYKTVGDAVRRPHYCAAPGVKKDDLVQRLGVFEDGQSCVGCRHYHGGDGDETCSADEAEKYSGGKDVYGWHISNLVIYDKPKELHEFHTFCTNFYDGDHCEECEYFIDGRGYEYDESDCGCDGLKPIKRLPQSWCYVEGSDTE